MNSPLLQSTSEQPPIQLQSSNESSTVVFRVVAYKFGIPVLLAIGVFAITINMLMVSSVKWIKSNNRSSYILLVLSLALADAWTVLLTCLALVFNSYLPVVHGLLISRMDKTTNCTRVVVEILRISSIYTSLMHLLLLAFHHFDGVRNPIENRCGFRSNRTKITIICLWLIPCSILLITSGSINNQGFQNKHCWSLFLIGFNFKVIVFVAFIIPFIGIMGIYIYLFHYIATMQSKRLCMYSRNRINHSNGSCSKCCGPRLTRNMNAALTSLIVVGTFAAGWLPSAIKFLLICRTYCPYSEDDFDQTKMFILGYGSTLLVFVKLISNPIIYASRVPEIRCALWLMRATCCGCWYPPHDWRTRMPRDLQFLIHQTVTPSLKARKKLDARDSLRLSYKDSFRPSKLNNVERGVYQVIVELQPAGDIMLRNELGLKETSFMENDAVEKLEHL